MWCVGAIGGKLGVEIGGVVSPADGGAEGRGGVAHGGARRLLGGEGEAHGKEREGEFVAREQRGEGRKRRKEKKKEKERKEKIEEKK